MSETKDMSETKASTATAVVPPPPPPPGQQRQWTNTTPPTEGDTDYDDDENDRSFHSVRALLFSKVSPTKLSFSRRGGPEEVESSGESCDTLENSMNRRVVSATIKRQFVTNKVEHKVGRVVNNKQKADDMFVEAYTKSKEEEEHRAIIT